MAMTNMPAVRGVIFDLDGTLTDTLRDLCESTNYALRAMGYPSRTLDEVRCFVGNGIRKLIERAVPKDINADALEQCLQFFRNHYLVHFRDYTAPYAGIEDMLLDVRRMGLKTAIVSNKLQAGVDEIHQCFFSDLIDVAIGERDGLRRKPAPDMVELALKELGLAPGEVVYVGDSEVDVATARCACIPCISVLWGFRTRSQLSEAGATTFITHPSELLRHLSRPD